MKTVIGISGFIGSGKTTAGRYIESLGAFFIDADEVVNDLYKPGNDGYLKIVQFFGDKFLDESKSIDRVKLSEYVFGDANKVKILNQMIHPLVVNETVKKIDQVKDGIIVVEAVYFDEDMLGKVVDKILWIDCYKSILKERAMNNGMSDELFEGIIKTQSRPKRIDYNVMNDGSIDDFKMKLDDVWQLISKD